MDDTPKPRKRHRAGASRRASAERRRNRSRDRLVTVYWSDDEYAQLLEDAERAGVPVEAYLRSVVLPLDPAAVQTLLTGAAAELHKIGGYVDALVQRMDNGTFPEVPEAREAQANGRIAMQGLLRVLDGGSH